MAIELDEAVDRESIQIGAEVEDWQGAVRLAGELLKKGGAVEDSYIDAMVRTVDEMGPYAVIAPGVAIPHARPDDGAKAVGICVLTLATPVEFGAGKKDPVDLLFGFATPDSKSHTSALQALANFLEDEDNLSALREASTPDDVMKLLEAA